MTEKPSGNESLTGLGAVALPRECLQTGLDAGRCFLFLFFVVFWAGGGGGWFCFFFFGGGGGGGVLSFFSF